MVEQVNGTTFLLLEIEEALASEVYTCLVVINTDLLLEESRANVTVSLIVMIGKRLYSPTTKTLGLL